MSGLRIDIISDTVCPWCYVGKRHLEAALAQRPDLDIECHWQPFQLNPDMPMELSLSKPCRSSRRQASVFQRN